MTVSKPSHRCSPIRLILLAAAAVPVGAAVGLGSAAVAAPSTLPATQPMTGPAAALKAWAAKPAGERGDLGKQPFATAKLSKTQAAAAKDVLWQDWATRLRTDRAKEWADHTFTLNGKTLKWQQKAFGTEPKGGWNLLISMHGGGGAPPAVNDQQYDNQIKLYSPENTLVIAPRAPGDTWDLWHQAHVDPMFNRLIEDAVVLGRVNPNHVYLTGYSAGGDGTYQLAPRMADHWAAAGMMAGHPNDASPEGLRNIGFAIHVGALDSAYDRNKVAAEWGKKLDALEKADRAGYKHQVQVHAGRAHWMNLEEAPAITWMETFTRNPIPQKVVWRQDDVTHDRFYWLEIPRGEAEQGQLAVVSRDGQTITVEKSEKIKTLTILLNDAMLDLDKPVTIKANGKQLFKGVVPRTAKNLDATLAGRGDPDLMFPASVTVKLGGAPAA